MNKFTRITLLIVAVMAGTGILLCGISALMGADTVQCAGWRRTGNWETGM